MEIRIRDTGQVMFESEWRQLHSGTSFPQQLTVELLDSFGADAVMEGPQAQTTPPYEISVRQGVEEINGKWFTKYVAGPIFQDTPEQTAAEQEAAYRAGRDAEQARAVRNDRNNKLKVCDWTQLDDAPVDKAQWATYRQALRDITTQTEFPWTVTWPEEPK